jgi:hypothetical protein
MKHRRTPTIVLPLAALLAACAAAPAPREAVGDGFVTELLEASTRRPPAPERVAQHLPQRVRSRGLARVDLPAVTVELELRDEGSQGSAPVSRLRLVRFPDVVHLSSPDGGDEWLFRRNPVATDEAAGMRVDHASRFLIDYTDGELHAEGVLDGWARLAQLFVSPEELDELRPTGERALAHGSAFERRVRASEAAVGEIVELEWSDELGLPRRVVWRSSGGQRVQELVELTPAAPQATPRPFEERWPDYARKDLSDWREDVHGHTHAGAGAHDHDHGGH